MKAIHYDTCTPHEVGEFCRRITCENYFFSYFETPFLYERNGELAAGNPGDMLIIEPGMPIYHGSAEDGPVGFVNDWAYLHGHEIGDMLERYPLPLNRAFPVEGSQVLRRYIQRIKKEATAQTAGWEDKICYLTLDLIIDLHRINRRLQSSSSARTRLEDAREEILQHPDKVWTLEEMAALGGYSVSRFSALYREQFGLSPKQDILNARIDLAARMLRYTNTPVAEVASACGFQTIHYFSKYFKQNKGLSPKMFRDGPE